MWRRTLFVGCLVAIVSYQHSKAKILTQCEAATQLKNEGISKTFFGNWVCLMKSVSDFNTSKLSSPGLKLTRSYGIFQISSLDSLWCTQRRKGGRCNAICEDFLNDHIADDIKCAKKIFDTVGFKFWKAWEQKCKLQSLPNLSECSLT